MIRLRLRLAPRGAEVWAEGHAGYAAPGADIVCAGVSALLYGCLAYLREQCAGQSPGGRARVDLAEGNGFLWYRTRCFRGGADRAALEQLAAGLRLIAGAYPACEALTVIRTDFCKEEGHGRERNEKRNHSGASGCGDIRAGTAVGACGGDAAGISAGVSGTPGACGRTGT